ncbi:hypothetical protein QE152_g23125 [Popillia japonica]|uniref:Endonuclease/exonuclease/phosphatase domain-containing protein n=1 Tax=Popillia japonica TaxID=7064 RepID=A0AAW1KIC2_POPJA
MNHRKKQLQDNQTIIEEEGILKEAKLKRRKNLWKLGMECHKRSKIKEEEESLEIRNLEWLTETKKKGKGEILIKGGHLLLYSGVKEEKRATEGVGCFIKKEYFKYVRNWTGVTERILKVEMELEEATKTTIICAKLDRGNRKNIEVYGPNEDEQASIKDEFWDQLTEITERSEGRLLIIGDLNGRVGKKDNETGHTIGTHGHQTTTSEVGSMGLRLEIETEPP